MATPVDTSPARRLLIVDDEPAQLQALCETLAACGYQTRGCASPAEALAALRPGAFDLMLTDLQMPEMDGIALVGAARGIDPNLGAIVMTGHGTVDTAVQAMRSGALDYILKPFRLNTVLPVIERALDLQRLRRENAALQALEKQRSEELAAAYKDLESFSYSISHDLRAPLVFVRDFALRLEREHSAALGSQGQRLVRIIRDGSRSMDDMVVGLLAFSRASRQPLHARQLDMTPFVTAAVAESRAAHADREYEVVIDPLPHAVADPGVIRHVWSNLIDNAFKYSVRRPAPRIRIGGEVQADETIYFVQDNGAGFDMGHAEKLFEVFRRLHSADEYPGTGVGLAIVHRIIQRHGGRVWADAQPDSGACFHFALPAMTQAGN